MKALLFAIVAVAVLTGSALKMPHAAFPLAHLPEEAARSLHHSVQEHHKRHGIHNADHHQQKHHGAHHRRGHQQEPKAVLDVAGGAPDYGSYVTLCNASSTNVTFVNYPKANCVGAPSYYSLPLNQCHTELLFFSWNGVCNATNMWYNNFKDRTCTGPSALTRLYTTYQCFNCPNPECKNP